MKKESLDRLLDKSQEKLQLLASNRQIYQEVDMKDAALATARKESAECFEREHRLKNNIEALRRAIPRFLTKVNKNVRPQNVPLSIDQLGDVVHKLDDEVARLIKLIGDKMLKDATPEDLAMMSSAMQDYSAMHAGGESVSETSRLHKLPGFKRLQKQLFYNLMASVPDTTDKNIRVTAVTHGDLESNTSNARNIGDEIMYSEEMNASTDRLKKLSTDDVIDRNTIKSISKLITRKGDSKGHGKGFGYLNNSRKMKKRIIEVEEEEN
jgi:hypothetical protein